MCTPGALASPITKQAAPFGGMCAVPPLPVSPGNPLDAEGPHREVSAGLTFGAGMAAVARQQCGSRAGGHRAVLLHVLAVHLPHWLPPAVPLLWRVEEPGRAVPSRAKVCPPAQTGSPHPGPAGAPAGGPDTLCSPQLPVRQPSPGAPPPPPAPCPAVCSPASPGLASGGCSKGRRGPGAIPKEGEEE